MAKKQQQGIPVVVTTKHRGVFFGYADGDVSGSSVTITQARNCLKWVGVRGFIGLAATGPNNKCRVGPAAPELLLHDVTAVLKASPEAAKAWEEGPWAS